MITTLLKTKSRVAALGLAAVTAVALTIFAGQLPGIVPLGIAAAAPATQAITPPNISFTSAAVEAEEGETASIEVALSAAASADLSVGYTVAWPAGRSGVTEGTTEIPAGVTSATIEIAVPDDDAVAPSAREVLTVTLSSPTETAGYVLGHPQTKDATILEGVCDRSPQVRAKILAAVGTATECHQVTDSNLASVAGELNWSVSTDESEQQTRSGSGTRSVTDPPSAEPADPPLGELKAGDFRGMSGVTALRLENNDLNSIPAGVFEGLSGLETLSVANNAIATLDADAFNGLSGLQTLDASNNSIETLPDGIFEGLASLTEVDFSSNAAAGGFVLTPVLKRVDDSTFKIGIKEGAPFDTDLTLTVVGGTLSSTTASVSGGSLSSGTVTITREEPDDAVGITLTRAIFSAGAATGLNVLGYSTMQLPHPTISVSEETTSVSATEGTMAEVTLTSDRMAVVPFPVWFDVLYDSDGIMTDPAEPEDVQPDTGAYFFRGQQSTTVRVVIVGDGEIDDSARESLLLDFDVESADYQPYNVGESHESVITIKEGVCDRTSAVEQAILDALSMQSSECAEVTDAHLALITGPFDLSGSAVASLESRDFMGLSALTGLNLDNSTMTALPTEVFSGLGSLTSLSLQDGDLASLDARVFDSLSNLATLDFSGNDLAALPGGRLQWPDQSHHGGLFGQRLGRVARRRLRWSDQSHHSRLFGQRSRPVPACNRIDAPGRQQPGRQFQSSPPVAGRRARGREREPLRFGGITGERVCYHRLRSNGKP